MYPSPLSLLISHWVHEKIFMLVFDWWLAQKKWCGKPLSFDIDVDANVNLKCEQALIFCTFLFSEHPTTSGILKNSEQRTFFLTISWACRSEQLIRPDGGTQRKAWQSRCEVKVFWIELLRFFFFLSTACWGGIVMNMLPGITSDPLVHIWLSYYSCLQLTVGKPASWMSASIAVPEIIRQPVNECISFCTLLSPFTACIKLSSDDTFQRGFDKYAEMMSTRLSTLCQENNALTVALVSKNEISFWECWNWRMKIFLHNSCNILSTKGVRYFICYFKIAIVLIKYCFYLNVWTKNHFKKL